MTPIQQLTDTDAAVELGSSLFLLLTLPDPNANSLLRTRSPFRGNSVDVFPFLTFAPALQADPNHDATNPVATQHGRADPEDKH